MSSNLHPGPFVDYLELVPICLSVGNRCVVQTISKALLIFSGYFYLSRMRFGGVWQKKWTYHHIVKTSSRLRAAGSPHRGMKKNDMRKANFGDSLCMRTGHGERSGERRKQLAPGTPGVVGSYSCG